MRSRFSAVKATICKWVALPLATVVAALLAGCGSSSSSSPSVTPPTSPTPTIASAFFGMSVNRSDDPWPSTLGVPFASWRTLGSAGVIWAEMNPSPNVYDFSQFDAFLAEAQAGGQDVMFTAYATPSWDSSRGSACVSAGSPAGCLGAPDTSCAFDSTDGPGLCDPPVDINCDGTGTDQSFINFITAVLNHVGPGKIKYWEMWNEPNTLKEWNADADCPGTPHASQVILARMAKDLQSTVKAVDANALFTTPAATGGADATSSWLNYYLTNTAGANYADIIAFHGYVQADMGTTTCPTSCPIPENVLEVVQAVQSTVTAAGQQTKPLFDTEGSWGEINGVNTITEPSQQVAFLGRFFLLQAGAGVAKFYWYGWDFDTSGFLYNPTTQSITPAGIAYQQIVKWVSGNTVAPCQSSSTQWSCVITTSGGTQSQAMWDTSQSCLNGPCTTADFTAPSQFTSYIDLTGTSHSIAGGIVPVGAQPILLTTSSP
jgi:hypothetical protein